MADGKREKHQNFTYKTDEKKDKVERLGPIQYHEFFKEYLLPNKLCIFSSDLTANWRCRLEWAKDGRPNYEFLERHFGDAIAPVADCSKSYCSSQPKEDMKLADFLAYLKTKDALLGLKNATLPRPVKRKPVQPETVDSCFRQLWQRDQIPLLERLALLAFLDYKAYETPKYFKSDWLNEYWDQCNNGSDDYRFVYIGPKGSCLHLPKVNKSYLPSKVFAEWCRSYSWSANICGHKRWYIYPPGQEQYLYDSLGNLAYDITSDEIQDVKKFPKINEVQEPIIVEQTEGEVIFIPSGWHHQVHNMEDTISINHNWTNACGLLKMWKHLQSELKRVQESIQDCKDMENWHQHCQLMLKAMAGMDYTDFVNFLVTITKPRLNHIKEHKNIKEVFENASVFQEWKESIKQLEVKEKYNLENCCRFDVSTIYKCLKLLQSDESFHSLVDTKIESKIEKLLGEILGVLGEEKEMWGNLTPMDL